MLMANKLWREENISRNLRRRKARETMKNFIDFISCISLLLLVLSLPVSQSTRPIQTTNESTPVPTPWPEQFHALLSMNSSNGRLQITNLWYDWPKGLNVNIMQKELGKLLYDVEWNNGTSFYYTLGANGVCEVMNFEVGIRRPDFLDGATYLGIQEINSFKCNVWEKADFIWYYEDVVTKVPVGWDFYDGITTRVITYEVGAVLEVSQVQAPACCFTQNEVLQGNELQISLQGMTSIPEFEARKVHLRTSSEGSTVFYTSL